MARPRNSVPTYRLHVRSGKGRITVADHLGRPKEMFLPGAFNSGESLKEYERILGILRTHGGKLPPPASGLDLTLNELVFAFTERKAEIDYIDADGKPTTEQRNFRAALAPMLRLYGSMPGVDFGPLELKAVQRAMASGSWMTPQECEVRRKNGKPIGWCRKLVNQHVSRVRSLFKWAVSEKLASPMQLVELQSVAAVKRGRGAREPEPVLPVDPETVQKSLPHLPPHVRDMVLFQLQTGARPGETCALRPRDIDRSGPVWVYRLASHKTAHHGHARAIAIGPKAQEAIRRHLEEVGPDDYVFSPARQDSEIKAARRLARKTPVQPSQVDRCKAVAERKPKQRFLPTVYARAVARGAKAAKVEHWHPHQLRHTAALLIEREHGAEAARATLGHRTLNMTLHYAGIDLRRAAEVAAKMG
ncbi:MAG: tyrosine-type recombinase/integrase [Gemmataceae bacterium]|nr:tyrosine-type recombinase/integrase [Gemmataceae bacterium]